MKSDSHAETAITIRRMTTDDLTRVHELDQLCFSSPWTLNTFRNELEENDASSQWVAVLGDPDLSPALIVGVIVTWLVSDEVHIATLSVDPDHRRGKIASRLICTALRDGVANGAVTSTLEVRAGNAAAQRLYYKFGYQLVGRRPGYYKDNGEAAVLLTLRDLDDMHLDIIGCTK